MRIKSSLINSCGKGLQGTRRRAEYGFGEYSGARPRGRMATQRSKKGSEKVLGRLLEKGSQKGS